MTSTNNYDTYYIKNDLNQTIKNKIIEERKRNIKLRNNNRIKKYLEKNKEKDKDIEENDTESLVKYFLKKGLYYLHPHLDKQDCEKFEKETDVEILELEDESGVNSMILMAELRHYDVVKTMIAKGCDINHDTMYNNNLFMIACRDGNVDFIKWLIKNGFEIENRKMWIWTYIFNLSPSCQSVIFELIECNILKIDNDYPHILQIICNGFIDLGVHLIKKYGVLKYRDERSLNTCLSILIENRFGELVKNLRDNSKLQMLPMYHNNYFMGNEIFVDEIDKRRRKGFSFGKKLLKLEEKEDENKNE